MKKRLVIAIGLLAMSNLGNASLETDCYFDGGYFDATYMQSGYFDESCANAKKTNLSVGLSGLSM